VRTFEEIRAMLADKYARERKRLKSFGTKTDPFQMANVTARFVLALMSESRYRELKKLKKFIDGKEFKAGKIRDYIGDRLSATKAMSKAIRHMAEESEKIRPWKRKVEKKKHHKKHKKHGHS